MAETRTINYSWTKPDPGASANTWGTTLNATTDKIDAQMFLNQAAATAGGTYVGFINGYAGGAPPTNWLWCDNTLYAQTAWPKLYAVIGTTFNLAGDAAGFFRVPALANGRTPVGWGVGYAMGAQAGEASHVLSVAELAAHAHSVNDGGHTHGVVDGGHTHGITQSPHGHGVSDPQHSHGFSTGAAGWGHVASGGIGGLSAGNNTTDAAISLASTGVTIAGANANVSLNSAFTTISISGSNAFISLNNAGSGVAHNNMPPYCVIGFIIRAA